MAEPTAAQAALAKIAIVAKAARLLTLPGNPFGVAGEGEWAFAIKPDFAISELLYGLRYLDLDISAVAVTNAEVIEAMGSTADDWAGNDSAITNAVTAARGWVTEALEGLSIA